MVRRFSSTHVLIVGVIRLTLSIKEYCQRLKAAYYFDAVNVYQAVTYELGRIVVESLSNNRLGTDES